MTDIDAENFEEVLKEIHTVYAGEYRKAWRMAWRVMRVTRKNWTNDSLHFGYRKGKTNLVKWTEALTLKLLDPFHISERAKGEIYLTAFLCYSDRCKRTHKLTSKIRFHHLLAVRKRLRVLEINEKIKEAVE